MTDLPQPVVEEAARLTRLAREAADREQLAAPYEVDVEVPDEAVAYREQRDDLLDEYGYVGRIREERDGGATLVCYPAEWLDDEGTVRIDAGLDTSRATELSLAGRGEQGDFESAASVNDDLVAAVRDAHGDVHAGNVRAFADFMSNHYARSATSASAGELREFLVEYYPRNAWPTEEQTTVVEESLRYAFGLEEKRYPLD